MIVRTASARAETKGVGKCEACQFLTRNAAPQRDALMHTAHTRGHRMDTTQSSSSSNDDNVEDDDDDVGGGDDVSDVV